MDSRNSEATAAGTGEILQTSSYWTGLRCVVSSPLPFLPPQSVDKTG